MQFKAVLEAGFRSISRQSEISEQLCNALQLALNMNVEIRPEIRVAQLFEIDLFFLEFFGGKIKKGADSDKRIANMMPETRSQNPEADDAVGNHNVMKN